MFAFYIASYDKKKDGCHTLNDHGNLTISHGIIVEKIMEFYLLFPWKLCEKNGSNRQMVELLPRFSLRSQQIC